MRFKTFLFPLIVLFFTGCASVKTEFIYPEIPDISEPPVTQDYNLSIIKINVSCKQFLFKMNRRIKTMSRKLTTRFFTSKIARYEKQTGKGVMDLLDIGDMEVNKIANIIRLGNTFPKFDNEGNETDEYEEAYKKLDEYLAADPNNSIITAVFDLIDELDTDLKILKSCGLSVEDIKKEFMEKAKQGIDFSKLEKSDENETEHNNIIEMTNV